MSGLVYCRPFRTARVLVIVMFLLVIALLLERGRFLHPHGRLAKQALVEYSAVRERLTDSDSDIGAMAPEREVTLDGLTGNHGDNGGMVTMTVTKMREKTQGAAGTQVSEFANTTHMDNATMPSSTRRPGELEENISPNTSIVFRPMVLIPDRIIYNRMMKTGSRTITVALTGAARRNKVHTMSSSDVSHVQFDSNQTEEFVQFMKHRPTPLYFDRHMHFLDLEPMGISNSTYVQVVRDPIDRLVSSFYFSMSLGRINSSLSFDWCVETRASYCYLPQKLAATTLNFCGQDEDACRNQVAIGGDHSVAIALAKRHIIAHFAAVGLFDDMDGFLEVLEYILPSYFRGVTDNFDSGRNLYPTRRKGTASPETREALGRVMASDYEIYQFIKQRFYAQQALVRLEKTRLT